MMKQEMAKRLFCVGMALLLILSLAACSGQEEQDSAPPTTSNNVLPTEIGLDFELPVNYEETAKQLASDFTIQWAFAYRSNNNKLLETLLDDYDSMIRDPNTAEPRNSIVSAWNNDHSSYAYYWYTYVSGPTVSSVMAKDNYVEGNAVYLTIDVSLIGTIQRYSTNDRSLHGSPRSANDRATYEMYYDSDGWHFETANLRLS